MFYSAQTHALGQQLIRRYGIAAAARHLRNLGFSLADAVEYLAVKPKR